MALRHRELKRVDIAVVSTGIALGISSLIFLFAELVDMSVALVLAVATLCTFCFWAGTDYADRAITRKGRDDYLTALKGIAKED